MQVKAEIKRVARLVSFFWSLFLLLSLLWNFHLQEEQVYAMAQIQAAAFIQKDLALRSWATAHGGVYVRPTQETPPNPYLDVPNRDVVTTEGMALTLMNPTYITREIHSRFADKYGVYGHMTSLLLRNPINAPDDWERAGLERFAVGDTRDYVGIYEINGKSFLRLMKPLFLEEGCLPCHAWTGIPVGGVRGGINASVPLEPLRQSATHVQWNLALSHLGFWLAGILGVEWAARRARRDLRDRMQSEAQRQLLYQQATHDALTGLFNRRYLDEIYPRELFRAQRTGAALAVALLDIDHFKNFNDRYGHEAGDRVLKTLGGILRDFLRKSDISCRYGGEELFIIMPDTDAGDVLPRMEELRQIIRSTQIIDKQGRELPAVTVSIGVANCRMGGTGFEDLLTAADRALYRAKTEGRDRVVVFEPDSTE